jgi:hypothetical protein
MADSFTNFEKSVENMGNLASPKSTAKKKSWRFRVINTASEIAGQF